MTGLDERLLMTRGIHKEDIPGYWLPSTGRPYPDREEELCHRRKGDLCVAFPVRTAIPDLAALQGYYTLIDGNGCFDRKGNLILPSHSKPRAVVFWLTGGSCRARCHIWQIRQPWINITGFGSSHGPMNCPFTGSVVPGDSPFLELLCRYPRLMPEVSPRSLAIDGEGRLWVGTRDHGLYCFFFDGLRFGIPPADQHGGRPRQEFLSSVFSAIPTTVSRACTPTGLNKVRFSKDHFLIDDVTPVVTICLSAFL